MAKSSTVSADIALPDLFNTKAAGVFTPLEPGKYIGRIDEHVKQLNDKTIEVVTKLSVLQGPPQGENQTDPKNSKHTDYTRFLPGKKQQNEIAAAKVKSLTEAAGVAVGKDNKYVSGKLVGKIVGFTLKAGKPYTNKKGEEVCYNEITAFFPVDVDEDGAPVLGKGKAPGKKKSKVADEDWD